LQRLPIFLFFPLPQPSALPSQKDLEYQSLQSADLASVGIARKQRSKPPRLHDENQFGTSWQKSLRIIVTNREKLHIENVGAEISSPCTPSRGLIPNYRSEAEHLFFF
jgi:hypothetical protein